jgi:hypothetical protein
VALVAPAGMGSRPPPHRCCEKRWTWKTSWSRSKSTSCTNCRSGWTRWRPTKGVWWWWWCGRSIAWCWAGSPPVSCAAALAHAGPALDRKDCTCCFGGFSARLLLLLLLLPRLAPGQGVGAEIARRDVRTHVACGRVSEETAAVCACVPVFACTAGKGGRTAHCSAFQCVHASVPGDPWLAWCTIFRRRIVPHSRSFPGMPRKTK